MILPYFVKDKINYTIPHVLYNNSLYQENIRIHKRNALCTQLLILIITLKIFGCDFKQILQYCIFFNFLICPF